jgi:membrane-associated phospholipid phosphatase
MSSFLLIQSSINVFLQSLGTWLLAPMNLFSYFGTEGFFLIAIPLIYWTFDAALGMRLAVMLMLSGGFNIGLKFIFRAPRPYWINPSVHAYAGESSFGIPSAHAQCSISIFGLFAALRKNKIITWTVALLLLLIGISRLYLGVHFGTDVLAGWVIGACMIFWFIKTEKRVIPWISKRRFPIQILIFVLSSLIFLLIIFTIIFFNQTWIMPAVWVKIIQKSSFPQIISPFDPSDAVTIAGLWLGMTAGYAWVNKVYGSNFAKCSSSQLALKYIIGSVGILILWGILGNIFPRSLSFISLSLRYFRYTLIGIWVTAAAPAIFISLKISNLISEKTVIEPSGNLEN